MPASSLSLSAVPDALISEICEYLPINDSFQFLGSSQRLANATNSNFWVRKIEKIVFQTKKLSTEVKETEDKKSSHPRLLENDDWKKLPINTLKNIFSRLGRMLYADDIRVTPELELLHILLAAGDIVLLKNYFLTQGLSTEDLADGMYVEKKKLCSGSIEGMAYWGVYNKLYKYLEIAVKCAPINVLQQFTENWGLVIHDESIFGDAAQFNGIKEYEYLSEKFEKFRNFENWRSQPPLSRAVRGNNLLFVRHYIEINKIKPDRSLLNVALGADRLEIFQYLCKYFPSAVPPLKEILEKSLVEFSKKATIFCHYIQEAKEISKREFDRRGLLEKAVLGANLAATKALTEVMEKSSLTHDEKIRIRARMCTFCIPPRLSENIFKYLMTSEIAQTQMTPTIAMTHGQYILRRITSEYSSFLPLFPLVKFLVEERGVIPDESTIKSASEKIQNYLRSSVRTQLSSEKVTALLPVVATPIEEPTVASSPKIVTTIPASTTSSSSFFSSESRDDCIEIAPGGPSVPKAR